MKLIKNKVKYRGKGKKGKKRNDKLNLSNFFYKNMNTLWEQSKTQFET
jgi:hypothetical protein